ncbi:hypothetical protein BDZ97DRAFT_1691597 [Flammula alnicola]|nr:hypothetical protein BDZ97DRAFT_1691597 [Flammula alnicola]
MSTHLEDSDPIEDPNDDGQLTIRIPNPKVYMARQSQWIGRRGKPRCDNCRLSNSKCDRVLPVCNHCSWANHKECKYTPLPTPAHRGIPRCDRCRANNMKCDRNLPICNNCKECALGTTCNYTPKKRHKRTDPEDAKAIANSTGDSKNWSKSSGTEKATNNDQGEGHTFYGQNIAASFPTSLSPTHSETESTSDPDSSHTGRFTADFARPSKRSLSAYPPPPEAAVQLPSQLEIIPHTFPAAHKILINSAHIEPWTHSSFIPLPDFVFKCLYQVDPVEMPKRQEFDAALVTFQKSMMEVLRETAFLSVDKYTKVVRALQSGDTSGLSERMRSWTTMHRLCSGSDKYNVILAPRDSVFSMDTTPAESHKRKFVADLLSGNTDTDSLQVHHYDRLPVQNQLYDILTYAHRSHLPAPQMLLEVVRLRFAFITWPMAEMYVRMCPLCIMRNKQDRSHQNSSPLTA